MRRDQTRKHQSLGLVGFAWLLIALDMTVPTPGEAIVKSQEFTITVKSRPRHAQGAFLLGSDCTLLDEGHEGVAMKYFS